MASPLQPTAEGVSYSVSLPARTLTAVPPSASTGASQWLVGTTSLREENEVRVLEYDPAHDRLTTVAAWAHAPEVWDAACCPGRRDTFATVHSRVGVYGATVWQGDPGSSQLAAVAQLPHEGAVRRVLWSQHDHSRLLTVEESALQLWDVGAGGTAALQQRASNAAAAAAGEEQPFWTAALHPRDPKLALAAAGSSVQLWDVAAMALAAAAPAGQGLPVRDVTWAPNNEHRFATGGDDGKLRFWDTRLLARPEALLELSGHSHWVWRCAFNPCHDQLVLTASTDTTMALWFTPQLAKQRVVGAEARHAAGSRQGGGAAGRQQQESPQQPADGRAAAYDDHEDSVYGLAWSASDPWLFGSMSYDGRVTLHRVPKGIKYKVLI